MISKRNNYIDAHCHLSDSRFDTILNNVLEESYASRITYFVQGGVDCEEWSKQRELKKKLPHNIFTVFGIHPWTVIEKGETYALKTLEKLPDFLVDAVALGEIGLDFSPRAASSTYVSQEILFKRQIDLAKNKNLPVVIHAVHSHSQLMNILKEKSSPHTTKGIIHGFSASLEIAQQYIDLGFSLSLGAAATQKNYQDVLKELPLESIVIESDAPDMLPRGIPQGFLGSYATFNSKQLNTPKSIWFVAEAVGKAKDMSSEDILFHSKMNTAKIFHLKFIEEDQRGKL